LRVLIKFVLVSLFFLNLSADTTTEILNEFGIKDTEANRAIIASIENSISQRDVEDFKKIILDASHNATMVKSELEAIDAPHFLLYLAMTESKFQNRATSSKRAGGMWQFMPGTARAFGLDVNEQVDERRDPFLSTDTAFKYLDFLNEKFDKWYLSLMAYNCGDGCMGKAIRNSGSDDFATLLKSSATPKETKNFIKKIIKYTAISKEQEKFLNSVEPAVKVEKIKVSSGTKLATVGASIGLSVDEMKRFNPHIKNEVAPNRKEGYHFYIPEEKLNLYALNYIGRLIRGDDSLRLGYGVHIVAKGETLDMIAKKWDSNVSEIVAMNEIEKVDKIRVGDELKIPIEKTQIALTDSKEYTIKNGDTLLGISKKFDVEVKEIVALNDIKDHKNIKVGETIVLP